MVPALHVDRAARLLVRVPEAERAGIRDEASRIIREAADADGSVTFTQGIRYTIARNP